jgi:ABC-type Mn/Zn transport systems, ATPase component
MTETGRSTPANASVSASTSGRANAPVLELEHVTLELGDRTILRDTGFVVNQGEFIGVLGPNGAGKTTLMRAVLGLVPAASGAIRVLGQPVERGNASIGYMPQTRSALAGRRVRGRDFVAMAPTDTAGACPMRTARPARMSSGCWIWWAAASWPSGRYRNCRAASVSASCSRSACSATPSCCYSTNR